MGSAVAEPVARAHKRTQRWLDAHQRCSRAIFEAWLKPRIQAEPLVESFFGMKFESLVESDAGVECELTDVSGEKHIVNADWVRWGWKPRPKGNPHRWARVSCWHRLGSLRTSFDASVKSPGKLFLVHFKSKDLSRIHRQGQFWHIFFTSGWAIIAQDEVDTWTVQVLVTSSWRPNICLADKYIFASGRVFLSGDAAHQNIPTGGYGMNTALGDNFDIGWNWPPFLPDMGDHHCSNPTSLNVGLLRHETLNTPASIGRCIPCTEYKDLVNQTGDAVISKTPEGDIVRAKIAKHMTLFDGENKDHGFELGYRYNSSPVVVPDQKGAREPDWNRTHYVPSTWPSARAPHVFLKDGNTSIFDLFGSGRQYSLIDFSSDVRYATMFEAVAGKLGIPLKAVHLPNEPHVRQVWGARCCPHQAR